MALLSSPGVISIFFLSGPFAWNGTIGFWVPVGSYMPFLVVTFVQFYKVIVAEKQYVVLT